MTTQSTNPRKVILLLLRGTSFLRLRENPIGRFAGKRTVLERSPINRNHGNFLSMIHENSRGRFVLR